MCWASALRQASAPALTVLRHSGLSPSRPPRWPCLSFWSPGSNLLEIQHLGAHGQAPGAASCFCAILPSAQTQMVPCTEPRPPGPWPLPPLRSPSPVQGPCVPTQGLCICSACLALPPGPPSQAPQVSTVPGGSLPWSCMSCVPTPGTLQLSPFSSGIPGYPACLARWARPRGCLLPTQPLRTAVPGPEPVVSWQSGVGVVPLLLLSRRGG